MTEVELHAYVDGVLPASRLAQIETHLAAHPEEAMRVRVYREQNRALKALLDPELDEVVPQRLREAALAPRGRSRAWRDAWVLPRWSAQRIAASFALAFVGVAAGWIGHGMMQPPALVARAPHGLASPVGTASLARQAAIAHVVYSPDVRRPVEIGADQEDQLVAWLSKRLGAEIRPPKLGAVGYELIGGRLLPGTSGPVAQFMYHDNTGQRLTLYVSTENAANKDTAFRFAQEGPVNVFYWIDGKFGYAISAGIDRGELARVATTVFDQLQAR